MKRIAVCSFLMLSVQAAAEAPNPNEVSVRAVKYGGSGCPASSVSSSISNDGQAFTLVFSQLAAEAGPGVAAPLNRRHCQVDVELNVPRGWTYSLSHVDYRGYARLEQGVMGLLRSAYHFPGVSPREATGRRLFSGPFDGDFSARSGGNNNGPHIEGAGGWVIPVGRFGDDGDGSGDAISRTDGSINSVLDRMIDALFGRPGWGNGGGGGNPSGGGWIPGGGNPSGGEYYARRLGEAFDSPQWSRCGVGRGLRIQSEVVIQNRNNRNGSGLITVDSLDGELAQTYQLQWSRCR